MAVGVKAAAVAFFRNVLLCKAGAPELSLRRTVYNARKLYEGVIGVGRR